MSERDYVLPWKRGIGNDCHKIWDANGRLVATVETCADSTFLVVRINEYSALEAKLEATEQEIIVLRERCLAFHAADQEVTT